METNPAGWFEIPVGHMGRAIAFYERVFALTLEHRQMGSLDMAFFPYDDKVSGVSGSLVFHETHYKPSTSGILLYFTSPSGDLQNELGRVAKAGGEVLREKKKTIDDLGFIGLFLDTEGNKIAIHSRK
jgi:uncharacterized protein